LDKTLWSCGSTKRHGTNCAPAIAIVPKIAVASASGLKVPSTKAQTTPLWKFQFSGGVLLVVGTIRQESLTLDLGGVPKTLENEKNGSMQR